MKIVLTRIDDRLLHGQVTTVWAKSTEIHRILVVHDKIAHDGFRKMLLQQAAPADIPVHIIPVDKFIQCYFDPRFKDSKVMVLFTNPQDIVRSVDNGIVFPSINIGGMSFSSEKKMITQAVAVDEQDIADFFYLHQKGIQLEVRKVLADPRQDLIEILKKMSYIQ